MKHSKVLLCALICAAMYGCASLTLSPVDYSWPLESVLKPDEKGRVDEQRYNISFNIKPLLFAETNDSTHVGDISVRMIRDENGYYFITASKFKNVYVFKPAEGQMKLDTKILISQTGIESPAFNQRSPYIELLNGKEKPILLTKDGIVQPKAPQGGQK
jgi:hypothetical protein